MIYYVDIDETICVHNHTNKNEERDYSAAQPLKENIEKINQLYDDGHTIIYWTARGTLSGINWYDLTGQQLDKWGAKYHQYKVGKPYYDYFICDKAINSEVFFKK
jgi:hydroxymethylpyrimidine pyrophosphatase-like HAD family hydrolase